MNIQALKVGDRLKGLIPNETVKIVGIVSFGEYAAELVFHRNDGSLGQQLIYADALDGLSIETEDLPWTFDADAALVRLCSEAYRIKLAHLFDPYLAVHTSFIDPLPHQINAVYGQMLSQKPLRFLLADDPGAGKTIMAGLLIKELKVRGDIKRCLIVAPGSLVQQWQDELRDKFQLDFEIVSTENLESCSSGNAFIEKPYVLARLDMLSRNEEMQAKLKFTDWDLIICDEAHKMSAAASGRKERHTKRYNLGMLLSGITRHFLLLTATPHNGKESNFQLFLRLLDGDRFAGKSKGKQEIAAGDMMRRLVKEELLTFEGKPLFPERIATTLEYELSESETALYDKVTEYVRTGFANAEKIFDPKHAHAIGFALTILQRRLASSPQAIYQSLKRRKERLEKKLLELQSARDLSGKDEEDFIQDLNGNWDDESFLNDFEETPAEERAELEERILDEASAARTIAELEIEIHTLQDLELDAHKLFHSGLDKKWEQLSATLQLGKSGGSESPSPREKVIIFTEHRDTLYYLADRIRGLLGNNDAVVTIQGGMRREERKLVEGRFKNESNVSVLVATDAAGEGINLQCAHLMINYDLPWNPNRLEQRFGRIHRIGQKSVCHLWNLVASRTREGDVFLRLFEKLEKERDALGGKVFDVLGKVSFDDKPLRDLLIEAIRYGNRPDVRSKLEQIIDGALDRKELERLIAERSLIGQSLGIERVHEIRETMERIEAHRLQPYFIESFFIGAFSALKGQIRKRSDHRYSIPHVPASIREIRSALGVTYPIAKSYDAVTFEKEYMYLPDCPNDAALICPGHPLLSALIDEILDKNKDILKQGTVFIDDNENARTDRLLFYVEDILEDGRIDSEGRPLKISHRLHFVELYKDGTVKQAGLAPYLDYSVPDAQEYPIVQALLKKKAWWGQNVETLVQNYAVKNLIPSHFKEVKERRASYVDKVEAEVKNRLSAEIGYWDKQAGIISDMAVEGKVNARLNADRLRERVNNLTKRLKDRLAELALERNIVSKPPALLGGAWIIPRAFLQEGALVGQPLSTEEGKDEIERIGMETVMALEKELHNTPKDISACNLGYDIESKNPDGHLRFIEVKGRALGAHELTVTHNEMSIAANSPDKSILALVIVDGSKRYTTYFMHWLEAGPSFSESKRTLELKKLRMVSHVTLERETQPL